MMPEASNHNKFLQNKFKQVAKLIPPNSKILDIGCNNGDIRSFFENPNYFGVDLDKELINQLIEKGISAKRVDLNKEPIPFENEKFEYILLLDIIEHVVNPKKLLENAKKQLNPHGKMIITLPNDYHFLNKIRFVLNKHLTADPFAPFGHLHYFPIKSGENFLKKSNFKILKKIPIPSNKPAFLSQSIKNSLSKNFPQSFARDILYLIEPISQNPNKESY